MTTRKITKEKFRNFLIEQKGSKTVGLAKNICNCPLATFAKKQFNTTKVLVDQNGIITVKGKSITHESWMEEFVKQIDFESIIDQKISAYQALVTLDIDCN